MPRRPNGAALRFPARFSRRHEAGRADSRRHEADAVVGLAATSRTPAYRAARRRNVPMVVHEANARPASRTSTARAWPPPSRPPSLARALKGAHVTGLAAARRDRGPRARDGSAARAGGARERAPGRARLGGRCPRAAGHGRLPGRREPQRGDVARRSPRWCTTAFTCSTSRDGARTRRRCARKGDLPAHVRGAYRDRRIRP